MSRLAYCMGARDMTILHEIVTKSEWIIAVLALYVVAWTRFNQPPTNRSGTTFALFFLGVIFYFALLIPLWGLVMIGLFQGSIGFDWIGEKLTNANPKAQAELDQYAPIVATLIIVVASQFRQVSRIDSAARAFCINFAAIPREADRLAIELAQDAGFKPAEKLRNQIDKAISENIGSRALNFGSDGTLSARFTRAVALYNLFVGPGNNGTVPEFARNGFGRSAYARIMQNGQTVAARAGARYEDLIRSGLAFFTSLEPTRELKEALNCNIADVSNLTCSLVARYVLFCEMTHNGRQQRLAEMGFAVRPAPRFGPDKWAATILLVILLSVGMMMYMPGTHPIEMGKALTIAITFGVSIGFAVLGAIIVAQRFIERHDGESAVFPPIAELILAALIVVGLSITLRIGIPLVPALMQNQGFQSVFHQFAERWPGTITPFICTISLGLLCSYLGSLDWSWYRVSGVGALGNGLALMGAGWLVGSLLHQEVLAQFYVDPEHAARIIALSTGFTGFIVGATVLAMFKKSERIRKDSAEHAAKNPLMDIRVRSLADQVEAALPTGSEAARDLGSYTRANVEALEGRYVCFRPAFSSVDVINAYVIAVNWDEDESCLIFEERERVDAAHTQKGRVYIPDGRPFVSFVTVERGAIRVIMVSRPEGDEAGRGLITTLSNPAGVHFTPAAAPIVLRRVVDRTPQLGFVQPGAPDYEAYRRELEMVMPDFGFFASAPRLRIEPSPAEPPQDVRLTVVR
jgi:hypothetical protein